MAESYKVREKKRVIIINKYWSKRDQLRELYNQFNADNGGKFYDNEYNRKQIINFAAVECGCPPSLAKSVLETLIAAGMVEVVKQEEPPQNGAEAH